MGAYGATWEAGGFAGQGDVLHLLGSLRATPALIVGGAETVFDEVEDAKNKLGEVVIFAVNDVGMFLPQVDHWASLHSDNLGPWKSVRWLHPHEKEHTLYHSTDPRPFVDVVWAGLTPLYALSGYFAMQIAYLMGCRPIILCGCPGNKTRRFFEARARDDFDYTRGVREQLENEMRRLPQFKEIVRSMSGWTREFFGRL